MFSHSEIWGAVDLLAHKNGLSTSGLAKAAGLDPTTFNKSKRASIDGKLRWPSTESISKILWVTRTRLEEFVALIQGHEGDIALLGRRLAFFDERSLENWPQSDSHILFPDFNDVDAYAFEIGKEEFAPFFPAGSIIVASPNAELRQNDLCLVCLKSKITLLCRFRRSISDRLFYSPLSDTDMIVEVGMDDIVFVHRILWSNHI